MALNPKQNARLEELLKDQPLTGKSNAAIAAEIPCGERTVNSRKQKLAAKMARASKNLATRKSHRVSDIIQRDLIQTQGGGSVKAEQQDAEAIIAAYADLPLITPEDAMKIMSGLLADPGVNPQVRVAASKELENLRRAHAPAESLGPSAPLTPRDQETRLARLMDAVGPQITQEALKQCQTHSTKSPAADSGLQPVSPAASSAPSSGAKPWNTSSEPAPSSASSAASSPLSASQGGKT